ncbi:YIP1 family protein [Pseudogemmobacter sonorensis]|uniref:YIP1 family protein n=1 Tax=Pseudogemmobacter sonorensis TaxID=2989681 RepID=UPI0036915DB4
MTVRGGVGLGELLRLSLADPRRAMRLILGLVLPPGTAMTALALAAVLAAFAMHLLRLLLPGGRSGPSLLDMGGPISTALIQLGFLLLMAQLVCWIGRMAGGRGGIQAALLAVAWLEVVMLAVQLALIGVMLVLPGLAAVLMSLGVAVFLWLLTGFVAELHGFPSMRWVFLGIIATACAMILILSILLAALIGPEVLQNV